MAFARLHALELKPPPDVQQLLFLNLTFLPKMRSPGMHSKERLDVFVVKIEESEKANSRRESNPGQCTNSYRKVLIIRPWAAHLSAC